MHVVLLDGNSLLSQDHCRTKCTSPHKAIIMNFGFSLGTVRLRKFSRSYHCIRFMPIKVPHFVMKQKVKHLVDREEVGILLRLKESVNVVKSH